MFDTLGGLPLHPLAVHAVVILLPLMSLVTMAVAVRRPWRRFALRVAVLDGLVVVATVVAKQTGQTFQRRLSPPGSAVVIAADHGQKGSLLPLFALALFVSATLVWYAARRPALTVPAMVVAVAAGVAAIGWTVVVGDSGARAVWEQVVQNTSAP